MPISNLNSLTRRWFILLTGGHRHDFPPRPAGFLRVSLRPQTTLSYCSKIAVVCNVRAADLAEAADWRISPYVLLRSRDVRDLAIQPVQRILSEGEAPGHRKRGAVFLSSRCFVALLLERRAQQVMRLECGSHLHGGVGRQIPAKQLHSLWEIAFGAKQHLGALHQHLWSIQRSCTCMLYGVLHRIQAPGVAIEESQIQPRQRRAVAGFDGGAIFLFGQDRVLFLFGKASLNPAGSYRIHGREFLRLSFGLIASTAHDSGSLEIELSQIGASLRAVWVQPDRGFKFIANLFCDSRSAPESSVVGLFSVDAPQPKMILSVPGGQRHSLLTGRNTFIPLTQHEVGAAKQIVRFGVIRGAIDPAL